MKPALLALKISLSAALACSLISCASQKPIMLAPARTPTLPSEVKVYAQPPEKFQDIALLQSNSSGNSQQRMNQVIDELRADAAAVGANGILLDQVADSGGWRTRPFGYASTNVSNYGSGMGLGLGLNVEAPRAEAWARAIWVE